MCNGCNMLPGTLNEDLFNHKTIRSFFVIIKPFQVVESCKTFTCSKILYQNACTGMHDYWLELFTVKRLI